MEILLRDDCFKAVCCNEICFYKNISPNTYSALETAAQRANNINVYFRPCEWYISAKWSQDNQLPIQLVENSYGDDYFGLRTASYPCTNYPDLIYERYSNISTALQARLWGPAWIRVIP